VIGVVEQNEKPLENFDSAKELYLALREHIGKIVSIRRRVTERSGVLCRVKYDREDDAVTFSLGSDMMLEVNKLHRIEVNIDGTWKLINPGHPNNLEL